MAGGYEIKIAKLSISENCHQAIFIGDRLNYATDLIKNSMTASIYDLNANRITPNADFSELECRWRDIPSPYGETFSLLVATSQAKQYREVIETVK